MKSINVEILLGHNIGIQVIINPSENELSEDYLKVVDSLIINKNNNNKHLEKEIDELREKNQNNEYDTDQNYNRRMMRTLLRLIK